MKTITITKNSICFTEEQEKQIEDLEAQGFKLYRINQVKGSDSRKFIYSK